MTDKRFMYVPEISSIVRLEEDWTFALYNEGRNDALISIMKPERATNHYRWSESDYGKPIDFVTLSAGTELRVDRIYIRAGSAGYSSITFVVQKSTDPRFYVPGSGKKNATKKVFKKARFWAKLADVNSSKMVVVNDKAMNDTESNTDANGDQSE